MNCSNNLNRDLVSGKKKFVKSDKVKYLFCPQYDQLSVKRLLEFAENYEEIWIYWPDKKDLAKCHRQWLLNTFYSVIGKPVSDWAQKVITERDMELA